MEYFLVPQYLISAEHFIKGLKNLRLGEIVPIEQFLLHSLLKSTLITVLHKNIVVMVTSALDGKHFDQVGMVPQSMDDLNFLINSSLVVFVSVEGNDLHCKDFILIGLVIGLHHGPKVPLAELIIQQYSVCLELVVNVETGDSLLD